MQSSGTFIEQEIECSVCVYIIRILWTQFEKYIGRQLKNIFWR